MSLERHDSASTATLADVFSPRSAAEEHLLLVRTSRVPVRITPKRSPLPPLSVFARIIMIISTFDLSDESANTFKILESCSLSVEFSQMEIAIKVNIR